MCHRVLARLFSAIRAGDGKPLPSEPLRMRKTNGVLGRGLWRRQAAESAPKAPAGHPGETTRGKELRRSGSRAAFALAQQTVEVMCSGNGFAPAVSS